MHPIAEELVSVVRMNLRLLTTGLIFFYFFWKKMSFVDDLYAIVNVRRLRACSYIMSSSMSMEIISKVNFHN